MGDVGVVIQQILCLNSDFCANKNVEWHCGKGEKKARVFLLVVVFFFLQSVKMWNNSIWIACSSKPLSWFDLSPGDLEVEKNFFSSLGNKWTHLDCVRGSWSCRDVAYSLFPQCPPNASRVMLQKTNEISLAVWEAQSHFTFAGSILACISSTHFATLPFWIWLLCSLFYKGTSQISINLNHFFFSCSSSFPLHSIRMVYTWTVSLF